MPRIFKINVNGTDYDVTVQEMTDVSTQLMPQYSASNPAKTASPVPAASPMTAAAPAPATTAGSGDQCAQMGGIVASILVKQGQSVNAGDRIIELEAMKMKVPVIANCAGQVKHLLVAVGDAVDKGQPLLTLA